MYPLTLEEIEQVAKDYKDGLTRECERLIRRSDTSGALAAIMGKEYIDKFVYQLKITAGSELGRPQQPRLPKKRIRQIYIPDAIKKIPPAHAVEPAEDRQVQGVVNAMRYRGMPKHY